MSVLCNFFGHNLYFDRANVAGPSTCKRCEYKEPGIEWPRLKPTPNPKAKPLRIAVDVHITQVM